MSDNNEKINVIQWLTERMTEQYKYILIYKYVRYNRDILFILIDEELNVNIFIIISIVSSIMEEPILIVGYINR